MFFYVSKMVSILLFPFPLFFFILLVYLIYKKNRILVFLWLFFGFFSTEIFSSFLLQTLEDRFPIVQFQDAQKVDAAIVLGGLSNPLRMVSDWPEFTDGVDRILIAEELWRSKKANFIIISGGIGNILQTGASESITLQRYLEKRIPKDQIFIDPLSRNTAENAIESLKICKEKNFKKVYLITSAFHLYRAYYTFLKIKEEYYPNLEILPLPTDYRSLRKIMNLEDFFPKDFALHKSTIAIKEYLGILGYKIKGYL
ncbi:MAG: YdcF family protein [Leptonema sp. (in: bacteria)]